MPAPNQANRNAFARALMAVAELYGKELSKPVIELWWAALERFDLAAVESALVRHTQSPDVGQYMPKPADVIRMIEGTSTDAAQIAWSKVDGACRMVGPYRSVVFDDPIIHRVLADMGGWITLGEKKDADWPFVANEFRTRYSGFRGRGEVPEYPTHLLGIEEAQNRRYGKGPEEEPTLIGDLDNARRVLAGGSNRPLLAVHAPSKVVMLPSGGGDAAA